MGERISWVAGLAIGVVACASNNDSPGKDLDGGIGSMKDASPDRVTSTESSRGAGGLACAQSTALDSAHTLCTVKVNSVEVKLVVPKDSKAPRNLGIYLHGDGAGAHKSASALKTMSGWADTHDGLVVSALAPNGCAWWQSPTHDCASAVTDVDNDAANAKALSAVFDVILRSYDVRMDRIYYYGSSGGSIFLTDQWLPLYSDKYPGIFALMCGGMAPFRKFRWSFDDAGARDKFRIAFTYGDQDFLKPDIEKSTSWFKARQFIVTEKVIPGAQHCAFDAHTEAVTVWNAYPNGR